MFNGLKECIFMKIIGIKYLKGLESRYFFFLERLYGIVEKFLFVNQKIWVVFLVLYQ